ncbi:MAG: glycine cleavage system aminomethyltransferase GcvT [Actinobacteria bacterium]|nr:glycine cleavage system aminomethyltransferase GcvT [Actinomycetota bacterium]
MPSDGPHRQTPLADRHLQLGAKMTPFAGWEMPLDYGSVVAEHDAVRTSCGIFDLSHLGMFTVTGDGVPALQYAFTNDIERLSTGRAHYTLCCDDDGGVVDDLLVYHLEWGYLVICNAANLDAVRASVAEGPGSPDIADHNGRYVCIAVQGPQSPRVALSAGLDVHGMAFLDCRSLAVPTTGPAASTTQSADGLGGGVLARSGYTGERGYELVVPAERGGDLWDRLLAADGVEPAGLGARDLLRLEMGYPLHGHELHTGITPAEAGVWFAVATDTGFRGAEAVRKAKQEPRTRRLRGLRATARGVPRADQIVRAGDREVGRTTSGSFSPTVGAGIALAYVDADVALDDDVVIDVRGRDLPAVVVRPPFVDADPRD